jgi:uncharacterized protein with PQ loop repeat
MIKTTVDVIYTGMLICNALLYIPQARLLFKKKCSRGVSPLAFFGFMFVQVLAIANGFYYQDAALVIGKGVSLVASTSVFWLILYYRFNRQPAKESHVG